MQPEMEYLNSNRMLEIQSQMDAAANENEKRQFLMALVREIIKTIRERTVATIEGGVDVNNLDTITASLRNELASANKPITELLKKLNLTTQEQTSVIQQIEKKAVDDFNTQYQTVIVKRVRDVVTVDNLHEIALPDSVNVSNLSELSDLLKDLGQKIEALKLDVKVDAPIIHVPQSQINIPETRIPEIDFKPLITAIKAGLNRISTNSETRPLAVRMSDGHNWVEQLKQIADTGKQTVQYMSETSRLRDSQGNFISPATTDGQAYMLVPKQYDYILLDPPSQPTTITYMQGGAMGTVVATLNLVYSGSDLVSVARV